MAPMTACIAEAHAIREGQVAVLKKKRWEYGCKRCCGTLRRRRRAYLHHAANLRQTSYKWPAFSSTKRLEMAN